MTRHRVCQTIGTDWLAPQERRISSNDEYSPSAFRFSHASRWEHLLRTDPVGMLFVHVGQCGNQVGSEIWSRVEHDANSIASTSDAGPSSVGQLDCFLRNNRRGGVQARAVLVDTEPKVVAKLRQTEILREAPVATAQQGRGNNWAFGFHGLSKLKRRKRDGPQWGAVRDPDEACKPRWHNAVEIAREARYATEESTVLPRALEALRREAEACDGPCEIVLVHSLGGGTGSGLGARILEAMRTEMFRRNFILCAAVGPDARGDTVLQPYNAALCLDKHQQHADAVALFRNGTILEALSGRGGRGRGLAMEDVNSYVAASLLGALAPVGPGRESRGGSLVAQVAPHPQCKVFDIQCASISMEHAPLGSHASTWSDVARLLAGLAPRGTAAGNPNTSAATAVTAWGLDLAALPDHPDPRAPPKAMPSNAEEKEALWVSSVLSSFHKSSGYRHLAWAGPEVALEYSPWCPAMVSTTLSAGPGTPGDRKAAAQLSSRGQVSRNAMPGRHQTLTVASNRVEVADYLESIQARGAELAQAGAYFHWYSKYGVAREQIEDALENLAGVADSYRAVHKT